MPGHTLNSDALAEPLLSWFALAKRDLPWRRTRDPYAIWVSEVMLQQTQVATVLPYFARWMRRFPTVRHLADASQQEVLKTWEGLGYYSRARNFHAAARQVVELHGGELPREFAAFRALPGVGDYTAGAVLSFAFDLPHPAVDGNVARVLTRLFAIEDAIDTPRGQKVLRELAAGLIPGGGARAFNSALMELGATVCTPRNPGCEGCPVTACCRAFQEHAPGRFPLKARKRAPRPVDAVCAVLWRGNCLLLVRRPEDGLLGGLWEFPTVTGGAEDLSALLAVFGPAADLMALEPVLHVFTHLRMTLQPYEGRLLAEVTETPERRWVTQAELAHFPLSAMHAKVARQLGGRAAIMGHPAT